MDDQLTKIQWEQEFSDLCASPLEQIEQTTLDAEHPALQFHDLWTTFPRKDGYACRSAMKPVEIPHLVPWMMIVDVLKRDDWYDFKVRLHGTKFAEMAYGDHTGKFLEQFVHAECLDTRRAQFINSIKSNTVGYALAPIKSKGTFKTQATIGFFPMVDDRRDIGQIVIVAAPDDLSVRSML